MNVFLPHPGSTIPKAPNFILHVFIHSEDNCNMPEQESISAEPGSILSERDLNVSEQHLSLSEQESNHKQ